MGTAEAAEDGCEEWHYGKTFSQQSTVAKYTVLPLTQVSECKDMSETQHYLNATVWLLATGF